MRRDSPAWTTLRTYGSLLVGPTPSTLGAKANGSLEGVAARLAFPAMTYVVRLEVFGRFRHEQALATFGAASGCGVVRPEVHRAVRRAYINLEMLARRNLNPSFRQFKMCLPKLIESKSKSVASDA